MIGTAKQVKYAEAIRDAWVIRQHATAATELRWSKSDLAQLIADGDLLPTATVETLAAFGEISERRLVQLDVMLGERVTAKSWIESSEGQWFRDGQP